MAARKIRKVLSDEWKERIKAGVIMDRLLKHVNGQIDLTRSQISAADILLRKIVPDLARSELTGADGNAIHIALAERISTARHRSE